MIPCQRDLFELPEAVAYFNCAYTAPLMRRAAAAGHAAIDRKQSPWSITAADFYQTTEENRALFGRLVEGDADHVAVIPAVSYGIALAADNLPIKKGQNIVLLQDQFPSNVYPWIKAAAQTGAIIITVPRPEDSDWTPAVLKAIDADTAVAALPNCHWTDGSLLDLTLIGEKCRSVGAALVVDAIQSLGAMPFSVKTVKPDFLVTAAHKWLLGPYTYGFCYVADKWLNGRPLEENWVNRQGSQDFARLVDYRDAYQPGARRFDMGAASNFILAPIVTQTLTRILAWNVADIAATLAAKTGKIARFARELGFEILPDRLRAPHMLGLYLPRGLPEGLPARLAKDGVYVSVRGDAIRVAPHVYTSEQDLDHLFAALDGIVRSTGARPAV